MRIGERRAKEAEARIPAWVLRTPQFASAVRSSPLGVHVLLLLWAHADEQDRAWCSQRRLARLTGSHRRSVAEVLRLLEGWGWIKRNKRFGDDRERIEDLIEILLPDDLELVRSAINARLQGAPSEAEIPYFRADDIFQGKSRLYERMARIPLSALSSKEWGRLRNSGVAMHLYLGLLVYGPAHERVGRKRLAAEFGMSVRRVSECMALLCDERDRWITVEHHVTAAGGSGKSAYWIEDRLFEPAEALDDIGAEVDESVAPPADLVQELPGPVQAALDGAAAAEVWAALRSHRVWPRLRENPDQQARRLVAEYHASMGTDLDASRPEIAFARLLVFTYGATAWRVVGQAVLDLRAGTFRPEHLTGAREYIARSAERMKLRTLPT